MTSEHLPNQTEPSGSVRILKIEAEGDSWRNRIKPKIRLMGRWLEKAGFQPGDRVHVIAVAHGVIELRCPSVLKANELQKPSWTQPDLELG